MELLLNAGADPNMTDKVPYPEFFVHVHFFCCVTERSHSVHIACRCNRRAEAVLLIERGVDNSIRDKVCFS